MPNVPVTPAEIANYQSAMLLATYLYILAMYLSTGFIIAASFKKWKTSMVIGILYGAVIFILPYKISTVLGLIIILTCSIALGRHAYKAYKAKKEASTEDE